VRAVDRHGGHSLGIIQIDTSTSAADFKHPDSRRVAGVRFSRVRRRKCAVTPIGHLKKQAFERDLDLAHEVNKAFWPDAPPQLEGYDSTTCTKRQSNRRRLLDYVLLLTAKMAIVLGDVAGKELPPPC